MTLALEYPSPPCTPGSHCHADTPIENMVIQGGRGTWGTLREQEEGRQVSLRTPSSLSLLTSKGPSDSPSPAGPLPGESPPIQGEGLDQRPCNRGEVCASMRWAWGMEDAPGATQGSFLWAPPHAAQGGSCGSWEPSETCYCHQGCHPPCSSGEGEAGAW